MAARALAGFTLWAVHVPGFGSALPAPAIDAHRRAILTVGPSELAKSGPGDRIEVRVPLSQWSLGQETVLVVTAANPAGRYAGYSNQVPVHPLLPPGPTVWESHSVQATGAALTWRPAERAEEYAIERASGESGAYAPLGRMAATTFLDRTVAWDQVYRYRIRALRRSKAGWIEGGVSAPASIATRDTFPPTPPAGLRAVRTASTVELSWLASPENDVSGYRVYRDGRPVGEIAAGTTYSDAGTAAAAHEYAVSAFDTRGNESPPGPRLAVPAPDLPLD